MEPAAFAQVKFVGVAWYERSQYPRVLQVMSDRSTLAPTYDGWLKSAENLIRDLQAQGKIAIKANLDPDTFKTWCKAKGWKVDSKARIEWGNEAAIRAARDIKLQ